MSESRQDSPLPSARRQSPILVQVDQIRTRLAVAVWGRVTLQGVGAFLAALWVGLHVLQLLRGPDGLSFLAIAVLVAVIAVLAAMLMLVQRTRHGDMTRLRTAQWIEERKSADFALVTWVEQAAGIGGDGPLVTDLWSRRVERASLPSLIFARRAVTGFSKRLLAGPLLFVLGMGLVWLLTAVAPDRPVLARAISSVTGRAASVSRDAPIGAWVVHVTPPAYTGLPSRQFGDVVTVSALSGSEIRIVGRDAQPDSIVVRELASDNATRDAEGAVDRKPSLARLRTLKFAGVGGSAGAAQGRDVEGAWDGRFTAIAGPMEARILRAARARLLLVEGRPDSIPHVALEQPARDSVYRVAQGRIPLLARLQDDIGVVRAHYEVVVSSGEGERFTVRTLTLGARSFSAVRTATLQSELDLAAMHLQPGDVIHVRAVARDGHPRAGREAGTSETRSFRIARASEYDSVAVEPAPPPEVDKSLMSQRMLLLLTERLERRRPRPIVAVLREESGKLARDQSRLRQAVGDVVFQRLSGDAGGEHSHSADDGHDHGVEAVGGKLALSGVSAQGMLEEGDDSPVIAINQPLLEAYNAMWDAGRALEQSDLRGAIPHMRTALAAIERARAAERLYLRGKPPTVIVDIAKVRLTGKDTSGGSVRVTHAALPPRMAAREVRLLYAASLATTAPLAARDSLALLRLESLRDAPLFARALGTLVDALSGTSTGNDTRGAVTTVDVTDAFLQARRALGGMSRVPSDDAGLRWSRGVPP